ncbi:hypothetical protein JW926_01380 [Candidatus Sumerlaeota bacterium]|nr:hypothetical protein [Candidatus Sumerlaeota bacterium]
MFEEVNREIHDYFVGFVLLLKTDERKLGISEAEVSIEAYLSPSARNVQTSPVGVSEKGRHSPEFYWTVNPQEEKNPGKRMIMQGDRNEDLCR